MPASKKRTRKRGPSALEWAAGLAGALISIGMIVFIGMEAIRGPAPRPPMIEVTPVSLSAGPGGYVMEVEVANRSDQTAAAVVIEGELKQGGTLVESSSATLAYVPGDSRREAGLIFSVDPRRYRLQLSATGYEKP